MVIFYTYMDMILRSGFNSLIWMMRPSLHSSQLIARAPQTLHLIQYMYEITFKPIPVLKYTYFKAVYCTYMYVGSQSLQADNT